MAGGRVVVVVVVGSPAAPEDDSFSLVDFHSPDAGADLGLALRVRRLMGGSSFGGLSHTLSLLKEPCCAQHGAAAQ